VPNGQKPVKVLGKMPTSRGGGPEEDTFGDIEYDLLIKIITQFGKL
jgi:hypothetical protein